MRNNISNTLKFTTIMMMIFSVKTERISFYWAFIPMTLNFMMIVNFRLFKQDMRMLPVQGRLAICLYHFLEWSVLALMILMLEKVIVGWWLLTVPLMLLMLFIYILLHRVPIPFSVPKYAAMCFVHCAAMIIGTGFYFSGTD